MFGILENGILKEMPASGIDENGCLYVIDPDHAFDYAKSMGYKEVIETPYPSDGCYTVCYTDGDVILQSWIPFTNTEEV